MSRIFTFGCSFTKYNWPTWADLLSARYLVFNWGLPGVGNRAIVERLAEAYAYQKISLDDIVIIQWSHIHRHDYARPDIHKTGYKMWKTGGNIFSPTNQKVFNKKWIENFWSPEAYILYTLNNIIIAQQILKSIGCKWFMTSIVDIEEIRLESKTQENEKPLEVKNFWELDSSLYEYKETIWNQNHQHWLPPLLPEKWNSSELDWWFNIDKEDSVWKQYFTTNQDLYKEPHLTTMQYHNYLKNNEIYEVLRFNQAQINYALDISQKVEELKLNSGTNQTKFIQEIERSFVNFIIDDLKGR